MERINFLSKETSNLIQSSISINSFNQIVFELLYNSIDAFSTEIQISVSFLNLSIQVIDNGTGINHQTFSLIGIFVNKKVNEMVMLYNKSYIKIEIN